ncbi:hypothetical protein [Terrisporobacter sp.]|uniref:hypothetical protein n=1 Tax=Terrisporobacter sp. TaxID=1965305 RepID=UPI00289F9B90|nr:hypothetical protein [Terrisporobacter sp.]
MEIRIEDKKKIKELMEEKWKVKGCNMCGSMYMEIMDEVYELRECENLKFSPNSNTIQLVPIICEECGNTIFIKVNINN